MLKACLNITSGVGYWKGRMSEFVMSLSFIITFDNSVYFAAISF